MSKKPSEIQINEYVIKAIAMQVSAVEEEQRKKSGKVESGQKFNYKLQSHEILQKLVGIVSQFPEMEEVIRQCIAQREPYWFKNRERAAEKAIEIVKKSYEDLLDIDGAKKDIENGDIETARRKRGQLKLLNILGNEECVKDRLKEKICTRFIKNKIAAQPVPSLEGWVETAIVAKIKAREARKNMEEAIDVNEKAARFAVWENFENRHDQALSAFFAVKSDLAAKEKALVELKKNPSKFYETTRKSKNGTYVIKETHDGKVVHAVLTEMENMLSSIKKRAADSQKMYDGQKSSR